MYSLSGMSITVLVPEEENMKLCMVYTLTEAMARKFSSTWDRMLNYDFIAERRLLLKARNFSKDTFGVFAKFIHTGRIFIADTETSQRATWDRLSKCYELAIDKLQAIDFADAVLDAMAVNPPAANDFDFHVVRRMYECQHMPTTKTRSFLMGYLA
jgi:hypothetical protein